MSEGGGVHVLEKHRRCVCLSVKYRGRHGIIARARDEFIAKAVLGRMHNPNFGAFLAVETRNIKVHVSICFTLNDYTESSRSTDPCQTANSPT